MRALLGWALISVLIAQPLQSFDFRKFFQPPKTKVEKKILKKKKKVHPRPTPAPTPQPEIVRVGLTFVVDAQWIATYRTLEAAWDYPIPEDDDIKFINGKYHVPVVVYRHYEDMVNTPRPQK